MMCSSSIKFSLQISKLYLRGQWQRNEIKIMNLHFFSWLTSRYSQQLNQLLCLRCGLPPKIHLGEFHLWNKQKFKKKLQSGKILKHLNWKKLLKHGYKISGRSSQFWIKRQTVFFVIVTKFRWQMQSAIFQRLTFSDYIFTFKWNGRCISNWNKIIIIVLKMYFYCCWVFSKNLEHRMIFLALNYST